MDGLKMRSPVRRWVESKEFSGETGNDRMKGVPVSARDDRASVWDTESGGVARVAAGRAEEQVG